MQLSKRSSSETPRTECQNCHTHAAFMRAFIRRSGVESGNCVCVVDAGNYPQSFIGRGRDRNCFKSADQITTHTQFQSKFLSEDKGKLHVCVGFHQILKRSTIFSLDRYRTEDFCVPIWVGTCIQWLQRRVVITQSS